MFIIVQFHFNDEDHPVAFSGVEGEVTDFILPCVGDIVRHRDVGGHLFIGKVTERTYSYDLPNGINVDGAVTVTICLNRIQFK